MPKLPNHFHSFWKNLTDAQLVHKLEERMSRWYTFKEISIQLGIPVKSIYFYHERGDGPRVHKFGRHLRVLDMTYCGCKKINIKKTKSHEQERF